MEATLRPLSGDNVAHQGEGLRTIATLLTASSPPGAADSVFYEARDPAIELLITAVLEPFQLVEGFRDTLEDEVHRAAVAQADGLAERTMEDADEAVGAAGEGVERISVACSGSFYDGPESFGHGSFCSW